MPRNSNWSTDAIKMMSVIWDQKLNKVPLKVLPKSCPFIGLDEGLNGYRSYANSIL